MQEGKWFIRSCLAQVAEREARGERGQVERTADWRSDTVPFRSDPPYNWDAATLFKHYIEP